MEQLVKYLHSFRIVVQVPLKEFGINTMKPSRLRPKGRELVAGNLI